MEHGQARLGLGAEAAPVSQFALGALRPIASERTVAETRVVDVGLNAPPQGRNADTRRDIET